MSLTHWIWISNLQIRPKILRELLYDMDPEQIYEADLDTLRYHVDGSVLGALTRRSLTSAREILDRCRKQGIRPITLRDAAYPEQLRCTEDAPAVLYVRGNLPDLSQRLVIAIVGTRHADAMAMEQTRRIAASLARAGAVILSGMALGLDACAHEGALEVGGDTLAVLGCGPDVCYPAQNRQLMADILEHGGILSEYPPGTEPAGFRFPARNRIIAGISNGILVTAAPARSGSLITARIGMEQGREVFLLPGKVGDRLYEGSLEFLKEGGQLVTCARDILEAFAGTFALRAARPTHAAPAAAEPKAYAPRQPRRQPENAEAPALPRHSPAPIPQETAQPEPASIPAAKPAGSGALPAYWNALNASQQAIVRILLDGPLFIDEIKRRLDAEGDTKTDMRTLLGRLSVLEMQDYIRQQPGSDYILVPETQA